VLVTYPSYSFQCWAIWFSEMPLSRTVSGELSLRKPWVVLLLFVRFGCLVRIRPGDSCKGVAREHRRDEGRASAMRTNARRFMVVFQNPS